MREPAYAHSPADGDWNQAHDLRDHLESVAALARSAADVFGGGELAHLAGLWHDLGKYRRNFQDYIRGNFHGEPQLKSHKWAGVAHALAHQLRPVAMVIAGHHGGLYGQAEFKAREQQAKQELADACAAGIPADLLAVPPTQLPAAFTALVRQHPGDCQALTELFVRFLFSALVDGDYLDTSHFYAPADAVLRAAERARQASPEMLAHTLDEHLARLSAAAPDTAVNHARARVLAACRQAAHEAPGCFSLTVPTGGGKTLSAMAFALAHAHRHGLRHVIVVLPFTSIIEQNAAVYASIFGAENVLEHHAAWEPGDTPGGECASHRHKLLTENWDAPIIVTTAVQFLESLHHNRPSSCRKLHRIAGSVVIMDEIQTLPAPLLDVTLETLRALTLGFRVSLVCCTATQPALARHTDVNGRLREQLGTLREIVPDPPALFRALRRVAVIWPPSDEQPEDWQDLRAAIAPLPRVLVIVHRRQDAWQLARDLGSEWLHLSASMLPQHRSRTIAAIKARLATGEACRVISTQLVEAGVDIDFPVVYRAMAGCESLAQSMGRCNREGRLEDLGRFHIFQAPTPPPRGILQKGLAVTRKLLREIGSLDLDDPHLYPRYFHELYGATATDKLCDARAAMDFQRLGREYRVIEEENQLSVVVPWPQLSPDILAAVDRLRVGRPRGGDLRLASRASVTLPTAIAAQWQAGGLITVDRHFPIPIFNLKDYPDRYDDRLGLDLFSEDPLPTHNNVF